MKKTYCIITALLITATACKRDTVIAGTPIETPVITSVSKTTVQAGDTIRITGSRLQQDTLSTELSLSGRPARIIQLDATSITAIIPENTYSGKLMVTVSRNSQFASGYGPELTVHGTPAILAFTPAYGFEGDTVTLTVKNFSAVNTDNVVALGGKSMEITYNNNKDTLKVVIPQGASTAPFSWSTYSGPVHTGSQLLVRQKNYHAASLLEWLAKDPAFSLTHYALTHTSTTIQYSYDTLAPFLNGVEPCAIFISTNKGYGPEMNIYTEQDMLRKIENRPFEMSCRILASVLPGFAPPTPLEAGTFATPLNENIIYPHEAHVRERRPNKVQITKEGDDYYIQALTLWWTLGNRQKIRFVAQVGNSYLYEITGPLPYDIDF